MKLADWLKKNKAGYNQKLYRHTTRKDADGDLIHAWMTPQFEKTYLAGGWTKVLDYPKPEKYTAPEYDAIGDKEREPAKDNDYEGTDEEPVVVRKAGRPKKN